MELPSPNTLVRVFPITVRNTLTKVVGCRMCGEGISYPRQWTVLGRQLVSQMGAQNKTRTIAISPWVSRNLSTRWGHRKWHHKLGQMIPNSIRASPKPDCLASDLWTQWKCLRRITAHRDVTSQSGAKISANPGWYCLKWQGSYPITKRVYPNPLL